MLSWQALSERMNPRAWARQAPPSLVLGAGAAMAGAILALLLDRELATIPSELWMHRDDGVITLSHARNLVDFGFIGVSPSGERVEGYSAPLQLVVFALAYALTHVDYVRFVDAQVTSCGVGLGAALFSVFFLCSRRVWLAIAATVVAGLLLRQSATFLLWHASGMENSITHVFYLSTWVVLLRHLEKPAVPLGWVVVPLLAAWSRFESILHIAPMVGALAWVHFRAFRNLQGLRWFGVFLGGWTLLFLTRTFYFGEWLPNTAQAQQIALGAHLKELLLGTAPAATLELAWTIFRGNLGVVLLAAIPLLAVAPATRTTRFVALLGALGALAATLNAFLFGAARLDPARTTTFLAPLTVASVLALALALRGLHRNLAALVLFASPLVRPFVRVAPYPLCCAAQLFEDNRSEFLRMRERHALPRPLVANPDLGVISFFKDFNVLDLGYLGSSVIPRLSSRVLIDDYVLRIAAPDFVSLHANWATHDYLSLLVDPRFREQYEPWPARPSRFVLGYCVGDCFWVRRATQRGAPTAERALIDEFGAKHDPSLLSRAVQECNISGERDACLHVVRTVYRFLPDLSRAERDGAHAAVATIRDLRQRELGAAILQGNTRGGLALPVQRYLAARD